MTRFGGMRFACVIYSVLYQPSSSFCIKSYCRDAATSARLNWDGNWKSQRSDKLSMAYNAVRALHYFQPFVIDLIRLRKPSPRPVASKANGPSTALSNSTTTARLTGAASARGRHTVAGKLRRVALLAPSLLATPLLVLPRRSARTARLAPITRPQPAHLVPALVLSTIIGSAIQMMTMTTRTSL
jgi:hypothetical protein